MSRFKNDVCIEDFVEEFKYWLLDVQIRRIKAYNYAFKKIYTDGLELSANINRYNIFQGYKVVMRERTTAIDDKLSEEKYFFHCYQNQTIAHTDYRLCRNLEELLHKINENLLITKGEYMKGELKDILDNYSDLKMSRIKLDAVVQRLYETNYELFGNFKTEDEKTTHFSRIIYDLTYDCLMNNKSSYKRIAPLWTSTVIGMKTSIKEIKIHNPQFNDILNDFLKNIADINYKL